MKYVLIVGDGMADMPVAKLNRSTPLEHLRLPGMAELAGGALGQIRTCPAGFPPGSDVAFLTLLGYDVREAYTGRSPLEAAGEQVSMGEEDISLRVNLVTIGGDYSDGTMLSYNGSGIAGADAATLMEDLLADVNFSRLLHDAEVRIHVTETFRHIAVMRTGGELPLMLAPAHDIIGDPISPHRPRVVFTGMLDQMQRRALEVLSAHPINASRKADGLAPANGIWFWGPGRRTSLERFEDKYRVRGAIVSAVPLVRGIGWLSGLDAPRVPGATGDLNTNYAGKVDAVLSALDAGIDFALIHIEAPDDESHIGNLDGKLEAIRRIDERVVLPILAALRARRGPFRTLLMPDHYTLLSTRTHDGEPVPFALYDSREHGEPRIFCEQLCAGKPVIESGDMLMKMLFEM